MIDLLLKLTLAPALVVLATVVTRRWGEVVGGIVIAVPVVAGPILLIFGISEGTPFVHRAAATALLGIVAVSGCCVACGRCLRYHWPVALIAGWSVYGVLVLALVQVQVPLWTGFVLALIAIATARRLLHDRPSGLATTRRPPVWDLPARAAATAVLVVALTSAASALGPAVSGLLTPFPVATSVVVSFTLSQSGEPAALRVLQGYLTGLPAFAAFFLVVAVFT